MPFFALLATQSLVVQNQHGVKMQMILLTQARGVPELQLCLKMWQQLVSLQLPSCPSEQSSAPVHLDLVFRILAINCKTKVPSNISQTSSVIGTKHYISKDDSQTNLPWQQQKRLLVSLFLHLLRAVCNTLQALQRHSQQPQKQAEVSDLS